MPIQDYGKGLLGPHPTDTQGIQVLGAISRYDFNKSTGFKASPGKDQGSSASCTWQAFCYYFYAWTGIDLSRKDGYSRTHLPGGGGYLMAPLTTTSSTGCFDLTQVQDPSPETEVNMEQPFTITVGRRVFKITPIIPSNNITSIAIAMSQYKGCIIGVNGDNQGWANMEYPEPPTGGYDWSHAIYCYDTTIINGQDTLIAESSYFNEVDKHYIKNNYFQSGNVFSPICMEVQELENMGEMLSVNYKGKLGWVDFTGRFPGGIFGANVAELEDLQTKLGLKTIVNTDGTFAPTDITIN